MRTRFERLVVRLALAGPDRRRGDHRLPVRHGGRRPRPAVLRPDRRDHHARASPSASGGGRRSSSRSASRSGSRSPTCWSCSTGPGAGALALVVPLAMATAAVPGQRPDLRHPGGGLGRADRVLQPPDDGLSGARFVDALIGGGVALLVNSLLLPADPLQLVRRAAEPVLDELAADAREHRPGDRVRRPGGRRARAAAGPRPRRARGAPARGGRGQPRDRPLRAGAPARSPARRLLRRGRRPDRPRDPQRPRARPRRRPRGAAGGEPPAARSPRRSATSPRRSPTCARRSPTRSAPTPCARPRCAPPRAPRSCSQETGNLSVTVVVGQVRSTAVDLLRGSGPDLRGGGRARARGGRGGRGQRPAVSWTLRRAGAEDAAAITETLAIGFDGYREFAAYGWQPPAVQGPPELARMRARLEASSTWATIAEADGLVAGHAGFFPQPGVHGQRPSVGTLRPPAVVGDRPRARAARGGDRGRDRAGLPPHALLHACATTAARAASTSARASAATGWEGLEEPLGLVLVEYVREPLT